MNGPLTRPEPRRIVPRAVVDALIADADREISSLEVQLERAVAAADIAEIELAELGIDERASAWATVQLERFETELRAGASAESVAVVEEARVRARLLEQAAESESRHLRLVESASSAESELVYEAATADEAALFGAPVDPAVEDPDRAEPTEPAQPALLASPGLAEADSPQGDGDGVFHEITPEALAADGTEEIASDDPDFWPAEGPRRRRFSRARTVAAPMLAGVLVVAAVVLRFG